MSKEEFDIRAGRLDRVVATLSENGLFEDGDPAPIIATLREAQELMEEGNATGATAKIREGEMLADQALAAKPWWWRQVFVFHLHLFLYYALIGIGLVIAWFLVFGADPAATILWVPAWAIVFGMLGATVRGIWFLTFHVSRRQFRKHWNISHLSAPIMGGMLGLLAYLLFQAGLLSVTAEVVDPIENPTLPMAISFIAGYSWEWIFSLVGRVTGRE